VPGCTSGSSPASIPRQRGAATLIASVVAYSVVMFFCSRLGVRQAYSVFLSSRKIAISHACKTAKIALFVLLFFRFSILGSDPKMEILKLHFSGQTRNMKPPFRLFPEFVWIPYCLSSTDPVRVGCVGVVSGSVASQGRHDTGRCRLSFFGSGTEHAMHRADAWSSSASLFFLGGCYLRTRPCLISSPLCFECLEHRPPSLSS
jgi:hypothetical protein